MTPDVAAGLAADLRGTFPCNRIIALNGMSFDATQAGFAFMVQVRDLDPVLRA